MLLKESISYLLMTDFSATPIAILFQFVDLFPVVLLYTILVAVSMNLVRFVLSLSQSCHLPNCHQYIHYSNLEYD